jgi:hypothetical protein
MEKLPPYVVAGDYVSFEGQLLVDSTGVPGATIKIRYCPYETPTTCYDLLTIETDFKGSFYVSWKAPHGMACRKYYFYAEHPDSGTTSDKQLMSIAYPTRISISAPGSVNAGLKFTVSGKLEYEYSPGTWKPLAGKTVSIYYDNNKLADVTTGSDGSYSATVSIPRSGTYTLKAVYAGEGLTAAATTTTTITVSLPTFPPILQVVTVAGASAGLLAVLEVILLESTTR